MKTYQIRGIEFRNYKFTTGRKFFYIYYKTIFRNWKLLDANINDGKLNTAEEAREWLRNNKLKKIKETKIIFFTEIWPTSVK